MDFLTLAENRFSVRDFLNKEIEKEKMDKILKAAQIAPTAKNNQPQKIYILKSKLFYIKRNIKFKKNVR